MQVLFVGSDPTTAEKVTIAIRLRWPDTEVLMTAGSDDGLEVVEQQKPDLVLFQSDADLHPDAHFIRHLREFSDVALIVVEHQDGAGELDEVRALELGADDYIRQSAGIIDIVARIVALLRRVGRRASPGQGQVVSSGALTLNPATYEVFLESKRLTLTPTEFRLLHVLLNNRGNVVTHEYLARAIWGDRVDSTALVKKYIQRLRRRLGDTPASPQWIASVHGVGYRVLGARDPAAQGGNLVELKTG